jgi:hypothetical protein
MRKKSRQLKGLRELMVGANQYGLIAEWASELQG